LGFANGIAEPIRNQIASEGVTAAIFESFGLSVIIWIALYVGLTFILQGRREAATPLDMVVASVAVAGFLAPSSKVSWLVLATFATIEWIRSSPKSAERAGALIVLAITVPMFWSKILFSIFSGPILDADATMVSSLVGMPHVGNVIKLPGQAGELWIAAGCSSLANVSLTCLWWVVLSRFSHVRGMLRPIATCVLACLSVMAINIARISLMALQPDRYDLLHGPIGAAAVNWLTTAVIIVSGIIGLKVDLFKRH
jgi:hypothetical protein